MSHAWEPRARHGFVLVGLKGAAVALLGASTYLERRHGSDAARRRGLLVGVHVDLDEGAPSELRRERLKVRPDHPARTTPGEG